MQSTEEREAVAMKNGTLTLRPAARDDLDAIVTLLNAAGLDQTGRPLTNAREISDNWAMASFDINSSTRVAEQPDGRIIGYIEIWDIDPVPVQNWVWGRVDPQFEAVGAGTAMMEWAEQRLQSTVGRAPEDARVIFYSAAVSTHLPSKQLFEDLGMTFMRRFWQMMITFEETPPEPVWPANIELSSYAERDDFRAIVLADDEAFRDHWGHVQQPEDELVAEYREWIDSESNFDPSLWFLAMDGEEIAGICLCSRERAEYPDAAWVNVLGVRRPWRGQGLGLALLHHAFGVFYREGKQGVGLGVDSANLTGATRLYEKAGMSMVQASDAYEKELRSGHDLSKKV